MIFRQLFEPVSCTYSYLIASRCGGEALIIDPVLEKVDRYMQLMRGLDLKLVKAGDPRAQYESLFGRLAARPRFRFLEQLPPAADRTGKWPSVPTADSRVRDPAKG